MRLQEKDLVLFIGIILILGGSWFSTTYLPLTQVGVNENDKYLIKWFDRPHEMLENISGLEIQSPVNFIDTGLTIDNPIVILNETELMKIKSVGIMKDTTDRNLMAFSFIPLKDGEAYIISGKRSSHPTMNGVLMQVFFITSGHEPNLLETKFPAEKKILSLVIFIFGISIVVTSRYMES